MVQLVDSKNGLNQAYYNKRKHKIVFFCLTVLAILIVSVIMVTSTDKYIVNLIFSILITACYLMYLVFYFTVLKRRVNAEFNFYNDLSKVALSEAKIKFLNYEKNTKESNQIEYFVINANVPNQYGDEDKFFLIKEKVDFKEGKTYKVKLFGSVIISMEECK